MPTAVRCEKEHGPGPTDAAAPPLLPPLRPRTVRSRAEHATNTGLPRLGAACWVTKGSPEVVGGRLCWLTGLWGPLGRPRAFEPTHLGNGIRASVTVLHIVYHSSHTSPRNP